MGFCAFCKVAVDPNIEQCSECGNRRFRFLTGRRKKASIQPPYVGVKDLAIELEDKLGRIPSLAESESYLNAYYRPTTVKWMEYIDTRTEETWWERFDEIDKP